jgi:hypothetical protein
LLSFGHPIAFTLFMCHEQKQWIELADRIISFGPYSPTAQINISVMHGQAEVLQLK